MLSTVIAIYVIAGSAYWAIRLVPTFLKWVLVIIAIPVLVPVSMVKSLPEYLRKEGKWYRYRWLVYMTLFLITLNIILFFLPA
jgi:hypothetical protein